MASSSYSRITSPKVAVIKKVPNLPELPKLPDKIVNSFPELKDWYKDFKKWLDDYTITLLRNI